jgi:hypothetical protein
MTRKLSLALTLAAALVPTAASARAVPDAKPHCTECLVRVVAGGADSYRARPEVRTSPVVQVRTGGAQPSRRTVQAPPAAGTGVLVAKPAAPCSSGCCHHP